MKSSLHVPTIFLLLVFLVAFFCRCQTESFGRDKRQIMAKDAVRERLHRVHNFDVVHFAEDTLSAWPDSAIQRPIRYVLDFTYTDSTETVQHGSSETIFAPDGRSIIAVHINPSHQ